MIKTTRKFLRNKKQLSKINEYKNNNKIYILIVLFLIILILAILIYFNYLTNLRLDILSTNLEFLQKQQIEFNEKLLEHVANKSNDIQKLPPEQIGIVNKILNCVTEVILTTLEIIFK